MEKITATCPGCNTEYQLTQAQLGVANGQVRCGACMKVFHAIPVAVAKKQQVPASFIIADDELINDDDELINDNMVDSSQSANNHFVTDCNDIQKHHDTPEPQGDPEIIIDHDEEWAEQLLRELEEEDAFLASHEDPTDKPSTQPSQVDQLNDLDDLEDIEDLLTLKKPDGSADALPFDSNALRASKEDLLGRIDPEPIEFTYSRKKSLLKTLFFLMLALFLIVAVIAQFLFFKFDDLSKTVQWRPLYSRICNITGCVLPEQNDLQQISANHLRIKSHPYLSNILIADTILTNHAPFDQPFPDISLFFTDRNQQVIAGRRITPHDYLKGELTNVKIMPQRHPIHIAIELVDPGENAKGYFIQLKASNKQQTDKN